MNFDQKIVLVTGASSGIGWASAKKLEKAGATVIFTDINKSKNVGKNFYKLDISDSNEIEKIVKLIKKDFGRLDCLVANAGVLPVPAGINDITEENIDKTIKVNLKGTFQCLKIFGSLIQKTSQNGAMVAVSSVDGIIGEPYGVIYSATKAGIISLTKSFARYFNEPLVRVNAIAPGLIDTSLSKSTGEEPSWTTDVSIIKRMGKPAEVASAIEFLLSDEASFITGQILPVDGGFTLK
ncbi:MAG: hypothetical protein A3H51_00855 [Candidatus Spechtbacteria bacterium RIFCSPLOWO2_02_FULL_38_8]|uniref:Short-chain dehydrogenase n=1 Tax=Candidatus Spechtbacteria bacterium RIFCSPLOWO2_02_FULL_38_8 TaxID=1802164 RepID=A0A1G2HFP5_9BACT|nr:MAG: hypothetical protein A3H51_00855 [Candidatus Spechtbacteria bacterium RIFCSPLOWO2_02_FULL_38_8]